MEQMRNNYDVIIIGAGAVGCAAARELSRYSLRVAVLEKNSDVAGETTGRNSAVVHAGFNNAPGSRMASLCVEGNEGFEQLCRDLDVPYRKTGKLVVAFDNDDAQTLEHLLAQGRANGCRDLQILEGEELGVLLREHGMASHDLWEHGMKTIGLREHAGLVRGGWQKALWSPHTAITNPFLYCIALAENAQANGVDFYLNAEVAGISRMEKLPLEATGEENLNAPAATRCVACVARPEGKCEAPGEDNPESPVATGAAMRFAVRTKPANDSEADRKRCETTFRCRYLINCAGLQADRIAAMAGVDAYRIWPCRGEYFILDKPAAESSQNILPIPIYPAPRKGQGGLGVHLTPTIEGNIIIGPSAEYLEDGECADAREDYACTRPVLDELMRQAKQLMPAIAGIQPIGNYSGIRPKLTPPGEGGYHDFVIRAEESVPGLIDLIGIESPGLTASLPIARRICQLIDRLEKAQSDGEAGARPAGEAGTWSVGTTGSQSVGETGARSAGETEDQSAGEAEDQSAGETEARSVSETEDRLNETLAGLRPNPSFCGIRRGILRFREQRPQKQAQLIAADPDYGEIICRCQKITKREIRDAIENPLGARSISAIKYRAWATTGRCNGGYCLPRIAEILVTEYGIRPEEIQYRNAGSELFPGKVK